MALKLTYPNGEIKIILKVAYVEEVNDSSIMVYDKDEEYLDFIEFESGSTWEIDEKIDEEHERQANLEKAVKDAYEKSMRPIVGINIKWKEVEDVTFHYEGHFNQATVEPNGKVISASRSLPYAGTYAGATEYEGGVMISVTHKIDFINLWKLEQQGYTDTDKYSILVNYKKYEGILGRLGSMMPHIEYTVFDQNSGDMLLIIYNQTWNDKPYDF